MSILLCSIALSSCNPMGYPTVRFLVPNGFSGPFIIVEDPLGEPIEAKHGITTFSIPASGVLKVKSAAVLQGTMTIEARRVNGEQIPLDHEASPTQIALRGGGKMKASDSEPFFGFFIGTESAQIAVDFATIRPISGRDVPNAPGASPAP
ncbi:MAG: hypothetical protein V4719_10905 [Planctomycetota bacterium]